MKLVYLPKYSLQRYKVLNFKGFYVSVINLNNDIVYNFPFWLKLAQDLNNGFNIKAVGQHHVLLEAVTCKG